MGVAANHLVYDRSQHVFDIEMVLVLGDLGLEDDLEGEVTKLSGEVVPVLEVDGNDG